MVNQLAFCWWLDLRNSFSPIHDVHHWEESVRLTLLLLFLATIAGCGGGDTGPKLFPVSGKLTKGGTPLGGIMITLVPTDANSKAPALGGVTKDDGSFEIRTNTGGAGAPLGMYKVVMVAPTPEIDYATQKGPPKKSDVIPQKYTSNMSTDKTFEVKSGTNTLSLEI